MKHISSISESSIQGLEDTFDPSGYRSALRLQDKDPTQTRIPLEIPGEPFSSFCFLPLSFFLFLYSNIQLHFGVSLNCKISLWITFAADLRLVQAIK